MFFFFMILTLIWHWQVTILMPQIFLQTTATGGVLHFSKVLNPYRLPRSHCKPTHIWELNKLITYSRGWFLFSFLPWSVWVFLQTWIFLHVSWKGLSISTKLRQVLKVHLPFLLLSHKCQFHNRKTPQWAMNPAHFDCHSDLLNLRGLVFLT